MADLLPRRSGISRATRAAAALVELARRALQAAAGAAPTLAVETSAFLLARTARPHQQVALLLDRSLYDRLRHGAFSLHLGCSHPPPPYQRGFFYHQMKTTQHSWVAKCYKKTTVHPGYGTTITTLAAVVYCFFIYLYITTGILYCQYSVKNRLIFS